jgi:hypothetical protein
MLDASAALNLNGPCDTLSENDKTRESNVHAPWTNALPAAVLTMVDRPLPEESMVVEQIDAADLERRWCREESMRLLTAARMHAETSRRMKSEAKDLQEKATIKSKLLLSLNFEKTLHSLRRNDPKATVVDLADYNIAEGYAKPLGKALEGNTVVSNLLLNIRMLLSERRVDISLVEELLQFLSTSSSLRRIDLSNITICDRLTRDSVTEMTGLLVGSIAQNSCIVTLSLNLPCRVAWLEKIGNARMRLTTLSLWFGQYPLRIVAERDIPTVARCIASLLQLEYLEIILEWNMNIGVAILTELNRANSGLRHLRLNVTYRRDGPLWTALSHFILSSGARLDLVLSGIMFRENEMRDVLRGLDTGATKICVSQLSFVKCVFDDQSFAPIAALLQTRVDDMAATTCRSVLRDVHFENVGLRSSLSRRLADSFLVAKGSDADSSVVPTVGSQVRSVSLVGDANRAFFNHLGKNAGRVRLETLQLAQISIGTSKSLGKCLPKLKSLRRLEPTAVAPGGPLWIVHGLRQNGTLLSVETTDKNGDSSFDAAQLRLVGAFCERNRVLLGELLDRTRGLPWYLLPSLLQVAKQVRWARATHLVRGLLSHDNSEIQSVVYERSSPRQSVVFDSSKRW